MRVSERIELIEERWNRYETPKKLLIVFMLLVMVGYFAYEFVFADMLDTLEMTRTQIVSLQRKIKKNDPRFLERKILRLKKEIATIKDRIDKLQAKKKLLETKLAQKGYLYYNKRSFSRFLDRLLALSVQKEIVIDSVDIEDIETPYDGLLEEVKLLRIEGSGSFLPLVEYVRSLEDEEILFRLDRFDIETNGSSTVFAIDLRVLGVKE